jgi:hypothetical protein
MTNSARRCAWAGADLADLIGAVRMGAVPTDADLIDASVILGDAMSLVGICFWIFMQSSSVEEKAGDPVRRFANRRYALAARTVRPLMHAGKL